LLAVLAGAAFVIVAVGVWNLTQGEPDVSLDVVWRALTGGTPGVDDNGAYLVRELRLPRIVLALVAGAALGLAGVILQDSLRNPIADPTLLGVSDAAALVVASVVVLAPGGIADIALPALCLAAGLATGVLLVLLARSVRDPVRLILIGVVLASLFATLTAVVLLLAPAGTNLNSFFTFTTGSVSSANWDRLEGIWPWLAVAIPIAFFCGRPLNLLQLGDDVAAGLGMRVTRARLLLLIVAVLLVAPVVSVAGPIAFVAFLSPHVARSLLGSSNAFAVLPATAAIGAVVVLLADTVGRLLFFPTEIPAGIWTIVVAGPIAIWLAGSALRGSDREAMA
jgi:iron complex transport system permease protein